MANCAARVGGTIPDNMDVISDDQIMKDFEEKFLGYYRCAREAAPHMKQERWGRIINLSGGAGRTPGTAISTPARSISCVALTKSLANTLGPFGINVNAIYPGTTFTEAVLERSREAQGKETVSAVRRSPRKGRTARVPSSRSTRTLRGPLPFQRVSTVTGRPRSR